jgi:hypothetical protein
VLRVGGGSSIAENQQLAVSTERIGDYLCGALNVGRMAIKKAPLNFQTVGDDG